VLAQYKDELRIIGYYSKTLTETQSKYNIYTKELLAIVKSVEFFKQLLYGRQFKVVTDSGALSYFKSSRQVFDKYTRWLLFLEDFNIVVEHVKGAMNTLADSLTRLKSRTDEINTVLKAEPSPSSMKKLFSRLYHKNLGNHVGLNKMKEAISKRYTIPKLDAKLRHYLKKCRACNLVNQHVRRSGFFHPKPPGPPNT